MGSNVWVDAAGQAVAEPELVRDIYGLAAAQWVQESRRAQYVLVPASDEDLLRAYTTFVAEFEGVIGSSIGCSLELSSSHPPLTRPDHAGFLAFAAVVPHARGRSGAVSDAA